jgi:GTP cyclohydrolase I
VAVDTERIERAVAEILAAIGEDVARPGLVETPRRVAEAYSEYFSGLNKNPLDHLAETIAREATGELVLVRDIEFRSTCEHHLVPFIGVAHVAYQPGHRIVGLGKLPLVVHTLASRPQLQERLTEQVAEALETGLEPVGVLVVIDAVHSCVTSRGPHQARSSTVTMASRGSLSDPVQRAAVLSLIGTAQGSASRDGASQSATSQADEASQ